MSKNIVVDLDGVVCYYDFPKLIKRYFGVSILPEWIWCYSLSDCLGLPPDKLEEMFAQEVSQKPNLIKGAIAGLQYLVSHDYPVYILSNRLKYLGVSRLEDWLGHYQVPFTQVIECRDLPSFIWAAIDDHPKKLLGIMDKTKVKKPILFAQEWNCRCHDLLGLFDFAADWEGVLKIINGN